MTNEQRQFTWQKKEQSFQQRTTGHPHAREGENLDPDLTPFTKTNSKWLHRPKCKIYNCRTCTRGEPIELGRAVEPGQYLWFERPEFPSPDLRSDILKKATQHA